MSGDSTVLTFVAIFTGAALLSTVTLYARQSLLVAYIVLGVILGPWGLRVVDDAQTIAQVGNIGIMFLLFLLGLNLHPQKLLKMLREATLVTFGSSALFALTGFGLAAAFGFSTFECLVIGAAICGRKPIERIPKSETTSTV